MIKKYDYIIIGGGSGGIASANRAAMYGAKCLLIEAQALGGTCVNKGCVPKKVMWYGAQVAETIHHYAQSYGFSIPQVTFDFTTLKQQREAYISRIHQSYTNTLANHQIDVIFGLAKFINNTTISVNDEQFTAPHILIATGGQPTLPSIEGAHYGITSDGFFELNELPNSVAIVGAGYIAVEIAGVLNALGVETHLFVRGDRPLRNFDHDIIQTLTETMINDGIHLHTLASPQKVTQNDDQTITLHLENGKQYQSDLLIWAIGRQPNLDALNLQATDVTLTPKGHVIVDDYQNTTATGIYAVGDIIGKIDLTPVAVAAGRQLSERLFNHKTDAKLNYDNVATVIFSHPPIGTIGLSEQAAIEKYGKDNIKVYLSNFTSMFTAVTNYRQPCRMKLICLGEEQKVIGLHGIGYGVDEMIQGFSVAINMGATKTDFDRTIAIHPTGSEEFVTMR